MEYRVLGSLEVLDRQRAAASARRRARQQTVLASLLLRAGRTVPLQRLVDELWENAARNRGEDRPGLRLAPPPPALEPRAIESRSGGYALSARRRPARPRTSSSCWRTRAGPPWPRGDCEQASGAAARQRSRSGAGLRSSGLDRARAPAARRSASRRLRLHVLEDRLEADLGRGLAREVVAELQAARRRAPVPRAAARAADARALPSRSGRADALEVYRETRTLTRRGARPRAE